MKIITTDIGKNHIDPRGGGVVILGGVGNLTCIEAGLVGPVEYYVLPIPWHKKAFRRCIHRLVKVEHDVFVGEHDIFYMRQDKPEVPAEKLSTGLRGWFCQSATARLLGWSLCEGKPKEWMRCFAFPMMEDLPSFHFPPNIALPLTNFDSKPIECHFDWKDKKRSLMSCHKEQEMIEREAKAAYVFEEVLINAMMGR